MSVTDQPDPSDDAHFVLIHLLVDAKQEIEQLRTRLDSQATIGQAEGIVMERLGVEADVAFAYLQQVASQTNRTVIDAAHDIVDSRNLPDVRP